MGFDESTRSRRVQVVASALLLAASSAGAALQFDSPRLLVLHGLLAAVALGLGWRGLGRLQLFQPPPLVVPEFASDVSVMARRLALLESQLEQQPVALWMQQGAGVQALNARARRLIAPGGAIAREELLLQLARSEGRQLLGIATERGDERWLLSACRLNLAGEETRLLAMLPVESELEAETLKAWRQLVHVLTHEIMNSLTPIASLSRTALEMHSDPAQAQDMALALEAVARRAESLARFVADYRRVSDWPEPRPEPVPLQALFDRVERLVGEDWRARGGQARFAVTPPSLNLMADPGQLEQALLNLIRNAAQATAGLTAPQLIVQARLVRGGRLALSVRDNGPGVPAGLEQDIFLPFFSARSGGAGSGIGLAVVRNLVHGMGGTVRSVRQISGGACFVLSF